MNKKEEVYDEKIFPLMGEIIKICKENKITMFSSFGFDPIGEITEEEKTTSCNTVLKDDEYNSHYIYTVLDVILQCRTNDSFNIDKFLFWILKETGKIGKHSSIFLQQLGIDPRTGKEYENR